MSVLKNWWCSWFHGGGDIHSDWEGEKLMIWWQCRKCKREYGKHEAFT